MQPRRLRHRIRSSAIKRLWEILRHSGDAHQERDSMKEEGRIMLVLARLLVSITASVILLSPASLLAQSGNNAVYHAAGTITCCNASTAFVDAGVFGSSTVDICKV